MQVLPVVRISQSAWLPALASAFSSHKCARHDTTRHDRKHQVISISWRLKIDSEVPGVTCCFFMTPFMVATPKYTVWEVMRTKTILRKNSPWRQACLAQAVERDDSLVSTRSDCRQSHFLRDATYCYLGTERRVKWPYFTSQAAQQNLYQTEIFFVNLLSASIAISNYT